MSSSTSYQGLQSCLEPVFVAEPRVLRLKLAPPQTNISPDNNNNVETGGWTFLQSLAEKKQPQPLYKDQPYNPPYCKRGTSVLSEKSLEMCTESLGSETGSDTSDDMALLSSDNYIETGLKYSRLRDTTRMSRSSSFPPPLTSISSSSNVQMRRRRESGRLVLEAVSVSNSSQPYFQAERIDGRLRLHLMKDCEEEEEEAEEAEEEEFEEEEEEEEEKENGENGGGEMGMEKLTRLSRCSCKEDGSGNKSLLNWEPLWVAT
ncbi:protein FANTASTIC FOUR 1-like [Euphorbia lathyris]|uniref:protein FANTASTIC FOUR 1-like n=1 Tax=Euphorbia lathyris TaxID=212925 RepID=UPI0033138D3A